MPGPTAAIRLFVLGMTLAGSVRAEAGPAALTATLTWDDRTGGSCLDPGRMKRTVERHLGRSVFVSQGPSDVDVSVRSDVDPAREGHLRTRVTVSSGGETLGARTLGAARAACSSLEGAVVLVIAMLVDVPPDERPPGTGIARAAAPEPSRAERTPAPRRVRTEPGRSRAGIGATVGVDGEAVHGILPGIAFGAGVTGLIWSHRGPALRLGTDILPSATTAYAGGEVTFRAAVLNAAVSPFVLRSSAGLEWSPWVGVWSGPIWARSRGYRANQMGDRWFSSLTVGIDGRLRVTQTVSVAARLVALVPWTRPGFTYDGPGGPADVHRVRPVGLAVGLELGWGTPR